MYVARRYNDYRLTRAWFLVDFHVTAVDSADTDVLHSYALKTVNSQQFNISLHACRSVYSARKPTGATHPQIERSTGMWLRYTV